VGRDGAGIGKVIGVDRISRDHTPVSHAWMWRPILHTNRRVKVNAATLMLLTAQSGNGEGGGVVGPGSSSLLPVSGGGGGGGCRRRHETVMGKRVQENEEITSTAGILTGQVPTRLHLLPASDGRCRDEVRPRDGRDHVRRFLCRELRDAFWGH